MEEEVLEEEVLEEVVLEEEVVDDGREDREVLEVDIEGHKDVLETLDPKETVEVEWEREVDEGESVAMEGEGEVVVEGERDDGVEGERAEVEGEAAFEERIVEEEVVERH